MVMENGRVVFLTENNLITLDQPYTLGTIAVNDEVFLRMSEKRLPQQ
jgi:hypothetical protein